MRYEGHWFTPETGKEHLPVLLATDQTESWDQPEKLNHPFWRARLGLLVPSLVLHFLHLKLLLTLILIFSKVFLGGAPRFSCPAHTCRAQSWVAALHLP